MKAATPSRPSAAGLVAVVAKRGRFLVAEPFFSPRPGTGAGRPERETQLVLDRDSRIRVGDLVLVRPKAGRGGGHARLVRRLGSPDNAGAVLEAFLLDRGLQRRFDPAVEREAKRARDGGPAADAARRDLTGQPTFTIDPVTARDFDDAISAEVLPDGRTRVWVHIADVAAFVPEGSLMDREAERRGTSVYVPGLVEPMLPEALSNDACSLVPGVERAAVTVEMDFEGTEVRRTAFYRSTIVSDARLDYDRVDRVFEGREAAQEPWAQPLAAARVVAAALHERRRSSSALQLDTVEPEFLFHPSGHVSEWRPGVHSESHQLIEHLMIAANEQVARTLDERSVATLYRVHERPDPEAARRLVEQLASLDVATPPLPDHLAPSQAADIVAECSRLVTEHVHRVGRGRLGLTFLVLRALKQARYTPRNLGHAGLGLTHYCHFTSPIRRYPDLVCHRALLSSLGGSEKAPRADRLEEAGEWASARERDAQSVERHADRIVRCFLLERELFEQGWQTEYDGEVTGTIGAGAFVTFGDLYEGLLTVRRLRGDWWELNEEGTILHATRTDRAIRLGDPMRVVVERVDGPRGRVDLAPVEAADGGP